MILRENKKELNKRSKVTIMFVTMGEHVGLYALDCIKKYTPEPYELIIWNNGCEGNIRSVYETYTDNVINCTKNQGFLEALSYMFLLSHSEFLVIFDTSSMVEKGWLDVLLQPFSDPKVGCVGRYQFETDSPVECGENDIPEGIDVFRRSMINDIGGLCPSFKLHGVSQTELKNRALKKGWKVVGTRQIAFIAEGEQGKDSLDQNHLVNARINNNIVNNYIKKVDYKYEWWHGNLINFASGDDFLLRLDNLA